MVHGAPPRVACSIFDGRRRASDPVVRPDQASGVIGKGVERIDRAAVNRRRNEAAEVLGPRL
jgi:hypothetical protein